MWRRLSLGTQTGSQYLQMIGEIRNGSKRQNGKGEHPEETSSLG